MTIMGIYVLRSFGMAFIMMPMVTAAINALPGRLASHGNALLKYYVSISRLYRIVL